MKCRFSTLHFQRKQCLCVYGCWNNRPQPDVHVKKLLEPFIHPCIISQHLIGLILFTFQLIELVHIGKLACMCVLCSYVRLMWQEKRLNSLFQMFLLPAGMCKGWLKSFNFFFLLARVCLYDHSHRHHIERLNDYVLYCFNAQNMLIMFSINMLMLV